MEPSPQQEREVRAVRNQALFRAVNEKLRALNEALATATETFAIACECADSNCIEILNIGPSEYLGIRSEPRHFAVRPGHVYPDLEKIVREAASYVVVEKIATGAEVAELLAET
jgi:hypothetical protein